MVASQSFSSHLEILENFRNNFISVLIQLRKASGLDDSQVTEVLNEISRRIVQDKGN